MICSIDGNIKAMNAQCGLDNYKAFVNTIPLSQTHFFVLDTKRLKIYGLDHSPLTYIYALLPSQSEGFFYIIHTHTPPQSSKEPQRPENIHNKLREELSI